MRSRRAPWQSIRVDPRRHLLFLQILPRKEKVYSRSLRDTAYQQPIAVLIHHSQPRKGFMSNGKFMLACLVVSALPMFSDTTCFAAPPTRDSSAGTPTTYWDRNLPSASRFTILPEFNNQAVRDNTTGLIWERSPRLDMYDWDRAHQGCLSSNTGGRKGWRVPTVQELNSLIDPSSADVKLPEGHPFNNVEPAIYWSATKPQGNGTYALFVNFSSGRSATLENYMSSFVWCVYGGMNDQ
jgi:Protein of unknown function (DUF1566)